jgi:hypothetical protein
MVDMFGLTEEQQLREFYLKAGILAVLLFLFVCAVVYLIHRLNS